MGLFDKIKDNAKTISMRALEATREYDEDYIQAQQNTAAAPTAEEASVPAPQEIIEPVTDTQPEAELAETPAAPEEEPKTEQKPKEEPVKEEKKEEEAPRKSKITEVPRDSVKPKETSKPKPAETSKPYRPFYKTTIEKPEEKKDSETKKAEPAKAAPQKTGRMLDIAPKKIQDPVKQAIYARERAAMAALASQRRLNGSVPLYVTNHLNFKTRVFVNRIEYSGSFGKNVLPIEQVAWVKLRAGGTGVIIETAEGKRVVMVVKPKDRLDFADAVLKVQAMQPKRGKLKDTQTVRIDQLEKFGEGIDEIEKLAKLFDKGILSQEEFDAKKKQILGI